MDGCEEKAKSVQTSVELKIMELCVAWFDVSIQ